MTVSFRSALFPVIVITAFAVTLAACGESSEETGNPDSGGFTVVALDSTAPAPLQLAVQACAGLNNRAQGGSVYVEMDDYDQQWLDDLHLKPRKVVGAQDFLNACVTRFPACARYSYHDQQALLPNILTVAAVLGAVPLDVGLNAACSNVAFDATAEFKDNNTPYLATQYVFEHYIKQTTGLAMLDPGYDQTTSNHADPPLTHDMSPALVDYVFSRKLFVVFLNSGCVQPNPENTLLSAIVNSGQWPTPLGVYGYNDSWFVFGGYLYEAETLCLQSRNMGHIASTANNLSFFSSRRAPITDANELRGNAPEEVQYDPGKTYVAFVVGDGDNIQYMLSARHDWFTDRLADCAQPDNSCAPLTWTISPHLPGLAPDVLQWYYTSAHQTGRDYFMLPPSGHLYAYPASLNEADQDRFVTETEQDARILGVQGTVDWEWSTTWHQAEDDFLPKYATAGSSIRGVFPVNVPYLLPTFTWWPPDRFFEVLTGQDGSSVVLFRPREWRGVDGHDAQFFPTPQTMAEQLGSYPPGTVTWVYMTSDGGLTLQNSFMELVKLLPPNVQLVSGDGATKLALAASGKR